jgi:hypothetical protein
MRRRAPLAIIELELGNIPIPRTLGLIATCAAHSSAVAGHVALGDVRDAVEDYIVAADVCVVEEEAVDNVSGTIETVEFVAAVDLEISYCRGCGEGSEG